MGAAPELLEDDVDRFGDVVVALRIRRRISAPELARFTGITGKRIRAIEAGECPTMAEVEKLAQALQVEPQALAEYAPGRTRRGQRLRRQERGQLTLPGTPGSSSWDVLPFDQDPAAQRFVEEHPGGASVEEIAEATGLNPRVVERALRSGLETLRRRLEELGAAP